MRFYIANIVLNSKQFYLYSIPLKLNVNNTTSKLTGQVKDTFHFIIALTKT